MSSWSLSSWVNWSLSPPDISRKKLMVGAERSWALLEWKDKMTIFIIFEVRETSPTGHVQKGSLGVKKGMGHYFIICAVNLPETLMLESILAKRCACILGRALGQIWYGKESKMIGQRKTKTQKKRPHLSDLNHPFGTLLISEDAHTLLWVCSSVLLLS